MSAAKKGGATRASTKKASAARKSAPRTAPPARTAQAQRSADDELAATTSRPHPAGARGSSSGTEQPPLDGAQTRAGNRSRAQHAASPDVPADSTVRHAEPQTGKQAGEGEGGYPTGEYDVTQPAPAAGVTAAEQKDAALTAHFDAAQLVAGTDLDTVLKDALADSVLDESEFLKVLEALPAGAVLEHEAPNRWRCHKVGQGRYGHGTTALQAVEDYVIGLSGTSSVDAGARAFAKLPAAQRQEILDRDAKAAASVGGTDAMAQIRAESLKTAAKQGKSAKPAPGAASDGAEKASASQAQGTKASARTKRSNAAKRTASKNGRKR